MGIAHPHSFSALAPATEPASDPSGCSSAATYSGWPRHASSPNGPATAASNHPPLSSAPHRADPSPNDHVSLLEGADVYFVEDDAEFFKVGAHPSVNDVDKAYRKLAIKMHPDKNGNSSDATEAFKYLQVRYERFRDSIRLV